MRCFDLITEEGTLNNATFPAAVSRGPIGPAWLTGSLVAECLSGMLDQSLELGKNVQATCCGTWDTAIIAGLDERGEQPEPFLSIIMEPMAGGYGARPHADADCGAAARGHSRSADPAGRPRQAARAGRRGSRQQAGRACRLCGGRNSEMGRAGTSSRPAASMRFLSGRIFYGEPVSTWPKMLKGDAKP